MILYKNISSIQYTYIEDKKIKMYTLNKIVVILSSIRAAASSINYKYKLSIHTEKWDENIIKI